MKDETSAAGDKYEPSGSNDGWERKWEFGKKADDGGRVGRNLGRAQDP
jgi:hypothetical protein